MNISNIDIDILFADLEDLIQKYMKLDDVEWVKFYSKSELIEVIREIRKRVN